MRKIATALAGAQRVWRVRCTTVTPLQNMPAILLSLTRKDVALLAHDTFQRVEQLHLSPGKLGVMPLHGVTT
ncbi:hypothetical protein [Roseinatronobacter sp. NSM]|uniref:hypothetical protein n=1 Tax=Roseinatronobacter sp. NSM TaxID=3457785 RepID=UPI0040370D81